MRQAGVAEPRSKAAGRTRWHHPAERRKSCTGLVEEVRTDGLLGQAGLRVGDHVLTAVITAEALAALRLRRGDHAVAIFGSTDVVIGKEGLANGGMRKRERRRD
jgi:molybdopterin-binding protein